MSQRPHVALRRASEAVFSPFKRVSARTAKRALMSLGIALAGVFVAQLVIFWPYGLTTPGNWRFHASSLVTIAYAQIVLFVLFWVGLKRTEKTLSTAVRLKILLLVVAGVTLITLFILPTRSQDFYHDALLVQEWLSKGLNPYTTLPQNTVSEWRQYVPFWQDVPYVYAPLGALLMAEVMVVSFGNLIAATVVAKLLAIGALAVTMVIVWRIFAYEKRPVAQRVTALACLALNPITLQTALIDLHIDIFVGLGIAAAYWSLMRRRYRWAAAALTAATLIKFVPLILFVVLIVRVLSDPAFSWGRRVKELVIMGVIAMLAAGLAFAVFGFSDLQGLAWIVDYRDRGFEAPGALLLLDGLSLSPTTVRLVGLVASIATALVVARSTGLRAFIAPLVVFMAFSLVLFQPWYLLWIIPLAVLAHRYWVIIIVIAASAPLSPNINNSVLNATILAATLSFSVVVISYMLRIVVKVGAQDDEQK